MAKKNDLAQQPGGGMPQDENRMMQAAQLAAMMAQGMQQTRQPEPRREAEAAPGTGSAAGQQISAGEPAAGRTENPMVQMLQSLTGQTGGQTGQPEGTYFTAAAEPAIGEDEVRQANDLLQKYKAGKAALDRRIVDNELWFRMGHWKNYKNKMMEDKPKPSSGWLFNSIANKHADAMDNYPEPNVLPRAADDEQTAKVLSKILPTVLEQCDYETAYSDTWWRKLKTGTGVKGVFWDPMLRGGLGDISIRSVNVLMLYWEPGVEDIQDSPNLFSLSLASNDRLEGQYPQLKGHTGSSLDVAKYVHDDSLDTSDKSVVVDWYYKKALPGGQTVLRAGTMRLR